MQPNHLKDISSPRHSCSDHGRPDAAADFLWWLTTSDAVVWTGYLIPISRKETVQCCIFYCCRKFIAVRKLFVQ